MQHFDRIVIGCGGVGSAACYHLARLGARVLSMDRFTMAHDRGSSHGETRIIRRAYFEHPDYVPLLNRAYQLWDALQEEVGRQLFRRVGLLEVGPPDGTLIPGIMASVAQHGLTVESLDASDLRDRFSAFVVPEYCRALFEADAGFLHVERCVTALLESAVRQGATYLPESPVRELTVDSNRRIRVRTDSGDFTTGGLVIAGGAWTDQLLKLPVRLRVVRKHMHWFGTRNASYCVDQGAPVFFFELEAGCFYGFPSLDQRSLKIAEHTGGEPIGDPLSLSSALDTTDWERARWFVGRHLPQATTDSLKHQVCMYTHSPDEHFIVDRYPGLPNCVYAGGLSGHGFKFASVLGEHLARMSLDLPELVPAGFLTADRFAET